MAVRAQTLALVLAVAPSCTTFAQNPEYVEHLDDFQRLTAGVRSLPQLSQSGSLIVAGPNAFNLLTGTSQGKEVSVVASATFEKGLILAFGNTDFLSEKGLFAGDTLRLVKNAVSIRLKQQRKPRIAVYLSPGATKAFEKDGMLVKELSGDAWTSQLQPYDAVVSSAEFLGTSENLQALVAFVKKGGVYIGANTGWRWLEKYASRSARLISHDHQTAVFYGAGIVVGDDRVSAVKTVDEKQFGDLNCQKAMLRLIDHRDRTITMTKEQTEQDVFTLMNALGNLNAFDPFVRDKIDQVIEYIGDTIVPSPSNPLRSDDPWTRIAVQLRFEDSKRVLQDEIVSDPAARTFPGMVPKTTPKVKKRFLIDMALPGVQSTGLWINAGERVTLTLPQNMTRKGFLVQIGCHALTLWDEVSWKRYPEVTRIFPLNETSIKARSEFGGPVYIIVLEPAATGTLVVDIEGCSALPQFVLGETTPTDWKSKQTASPGLWADLKGRRVLLTVPKTDVAQLADPTAAIELWDKIIHEGEALSRRLPLTHVRHVVCDVQVPSNGGSDPWTTTFDLSDVGKVIGTDASGGATQLLSVVKRVMRPHQHADWTFDGTQDVTNRLFALYALQEAKGVEPKLAAGYDYKRVEEYIAAGSKFETWKRDSDLATMMYVQIVDGFGWDAFKRVFEEYRDLAVQYRPKSDADKRDHWLVRLSRNVGRDLTPFFKGWGIPVSDVAVREIDSLPDWNHPDVMRALSRQAR